MFVTVALFLLIRPNPLVRLAAIENRLLHFRSPSRSLWGEIGYVPGILLYPNSEAGLQKMREEETQKQLALGNLVTLRFPTTNLSAGYSKVLSDSARTNFKDGCWNFCVDSNRTQLVITAPPDQTNEWVRLVSGLRMSH
jgi:hypothetical protein